MKSARSLGLQGKSVSRVLCKTVIVEHPSIVLDKIAADLPVVPDPKPNRSQSMAHMEFARKRQAGMAPGQVLRFQATDVMAAVGLPLFLRTGHEVLEASKDRVVDLFLIRVGGQGRRQIS